MSMEEDTSARPIKYQPRALDRPEEAVEREASWLRYLAGDSPL